MPVTQGSDNGGMNPFFQAGMGTAENARLGPKRHYSVNDSMGSEKALKMANADARGMGEKPGQIGN